MWDDVSRLPWEALGLDLSFLRPLVTWTRSFDSTVGGAFLAPLALGVLEDLAVSLCCSIFYLASSASRLAAM